MTKQIVFFKIYNICCCFCHDAPFKLFGIQQTKIIFINDSDGWLSLSAVGPFWSRDTHVTSGSVCEAHLISGDGIHGKRDLRNICGHV